MGKTIGAILLVAAAVAINLVPGIGQAISGTLLQAGFAIGGTAGLAVATIGTVLTTALTVGLTVAGINALGGLLGLGPSAPKPETTETAIKTPRPARISAYGKSRLYGAYVLYEVTATGQAIDIYAVHEGKMNALTTIYLGDDIVTLDGSSNVMAGADGRYGGNFLQFYYTDGSTPGTPIANAVAQLPGIWTTGHRGDGVVAMALFCSPVKAEDFQKVYPQSQPPVPSIVAEWQLCPDPTSETPYDESGWTWTENPVRHLLHYELVRAGPRPALSRSDPGYAAALAALRGAWWASKIAPTLSYWIAAAADCDASRSLKGGGTEARYRSCFAHKHTDQHQTSRSALLSTFDGWMCPRSDGAIVIYPGRYYEPTVTIGPDEIVSFTWDGGGVDDDQAVNEIVTSYVSSAHDYASVECQAWRDEDDITARGMVLSSTLDAPVPSHAQARYLAKRKMARTNAKNRGTVTTNIAGRPAHTERFIMLHIEEAGTVFYSGPAEITALTRNIAGGVLFDWVEADPNIDAWDPDTEEGEPAPVGERVAAEPLDTPVIDTVTPFFESGVVRLEVAATAPDRPDLTWFARWRVVGASVWGAVQTYSDIDPGTSIIIQTAGVTADASVEIEVAYEVGDGRVSAWSAPETASTATSALGPSAITSFSAANGAGSSVVTWRNPTSANFGFTRLYRGTSTVFGSASQIGGDLPGALGEVVDYTDTVAAGTYYYWVRPYSTAAVSGSLVGPDSAVVT